MSKTLVIVESPTKAKTIKKILGSNYLVEASMGHVRDLPKSQFGVDVEDDFSPKYITIRGKGEILKKLRGESKKASRVLLATDPDREGEAISWELAEALKLDQDTPCRIEFHEITAKAIKGAVKSPRLIDGQRVQAQQARRILDRIVGYRLSPLLWEKVKPGLSAGRVQSVAVWLICQREDEIEAFVPQEYWSITAQVINASGELFEAKLHKIDGEKPVIGSKKEAQAVLKAVKGIDLKVEEVRKKERRRAPAPPFTTSSMQQEASRKLGFKAKRTMTVAQQLYEGVELGKKGSVGLITYMRTDSMRVAEEAQEMAREVVTGAYGPEYLPETPPVYKAKKGAQEAHEAIRPTQPSLTPAEVKAFLKRDQYRLYKLIWERFMASQMAPAIYDTVSADLLAGPYLFRATGSVIKFPGFMKLYIEGQDDGVEEEEKMLPELETGELLQVRSIDPKQHFTQPPPRYTEAMLVRALEEKGIGRPSTYATILETISRRGYVESEEKKFVPTELGNIVVDLLKEYFPEVIDVTFTAQMEERLDQVEEGEAAWIQVLQEFYRPFEKRLEAAQELMEEVPIEDEVSEETCEECGRNLVVKHGRFGKFLACPGFPDCRFTKPILVESPGHCPRCQGKLIQRKSRKGRVFYGCANYPQCDFTTWLEPSAQTCPTCQSSLGVKKGRSQDKWECLAEGCSWQEMRDSE